MGEYEGGIARMSLTKLTNKIIGNYTLKACRDPNQQTCKVCGRPDKFDFHIPDSVWCSIIPLEYRTRVVCLACLDELAADKEIDYSQHINELYFAGRNIALKFRRLKDWGAKC